MDFRIMMVETQSQEEPELGRTTAGSWDERDDGNNAKGGTAERICVEWPGWASRYVNLLLSMPMDIMFEVRPQDGPHFLAWGLIVSTAGCGLLEFKGSCYAELHEQGTPRRIVFSQLRWYLEESAERDWGARLPPCILGAPVGGPLAWAARVRAVWCHGHLPRRTLHPTPRVHSVQEEISDLHHRVSGTVSQI
ncbi:hypothetical protein BD779DRAFT_1553068 [Infundibulicybe gibba]|nr:hypothetical protein BD779DRAFT_1553068 [Infundibulicybe gibba]